MKVALSTIGKFHTFDLARELLKREMLAGVFSAYPNSKLRNEGIPPELLTTFPWLHAPYMALSSKDLLPEIAMQPWEYIDRITFDRYVARRLEACDVFVGLSGSALATGASAKAAGIKYVCDRGSSHIQTQSELIRSEHKDWNIDFDGIDHAEVDVKIVRREIAEYNLADAITVPSTFSKNSFIAQGMPPEKVHILPYGVDLELFKRTRCAPANAFNILFVGSISLRKGVQYLLQAYQDFKHPYKTLTFAGHCPETFISHMKKRRLWPRDAKVLGHVNQQNLKHIMSQSHALVLPSVEDGFGLVMAQAMACGCPVIATNHTGAQDLYTNGEEGFIIPIRDSMSIVACLQRWADSPALHAGMVEASLARVTQLGGWSTYGAQAASIFKELFN